MAKPKSSKLHMKLLLDWAATKSMSKAELADEMATSAQNIKHWINRGLPAHWYPQAAKLMDCSIDAFSRGEILLDDFNRQEYRVKITKIPVTGTARLDQEGFWMDALPRKATEDGYIAAESTDLGAYSLRVLGDSLHPRIRYGEYIVCFPNQPCQPGDDVAITLKDGRSMVRTLLSDRDGLLTFANVNNSAPVMTLPRTEINRMHFIGLIARQNQHRP